MKSIHCLLNQNNNSKLLNILSSSVLQNKNYFYKQNTYNENLLQKVATQIMRAYFSNSFTNILISNPVFNFGVNKVNINLFYYYNNINTDVLTNTKLGALCDTLSQLFQKEVNVDMIRIHYPYMNSQILAQYLVSNANTNTFLHFSESILTYPSLTPGMFGKIGEENSYVLSSYITDIRLELSGRLTTEQVVPRLTKKSARISNPNTNIGSSLTDCGLSSESMKNTLVDYGKYSSKNEMGTFMLKVWITSVQCIEKDQRIPFRVICYILYIIYII